MRKFWREYGIIGVLIVIAVGGYFLIGERREDILMHSLDAIGNRLTELVADDAGKGDISDAFSQFKERVSSREVAPEQIENVTANILNLSASGAQLSPEEAEMVLELALEPPDKTLPVPQISVDEPAAPPENATPFPPRKKTDPLAVSKEEFQELGSRVSTMVAFVEKMAEMAATDEKMKELQKHYQFAFENGLRVVVDTMAESIWTRKEIRDLTSEMDRGNWVDWRQDLASENRLRIRRIQKAKERIARARSEEGVEISILQGKQDALVAMERLNRLQELGLVVKMDTSMLRMRLEITIQEALKQFEKALGSSREKAAAGVGVESN